VIERLTRRDWALIAVCVGVVAVSLFIVFNWFYAAFPEASIDFRYDRDTSLPLARRILDTQRIDVRNMKHAALFDGDEIAKIFLERSLGLAAANKLMRTEVRIWWWRHRKVSLLLMIALVILGLNLIALTALQTWSGELFFGKTVTPTDYREYRFVYL